MRRFRLLRWHCAVSGRPDAVLHVRTRAGGSVANIASQGTFLCFCDFDCVCSFIRISVCANDTHAVYNTVGALAAAAVLLFATAQLVVIIVRQTLSIGLMSPALISALCCGAAAPLLVNAVLSRGVMQAANVKPAQQAAELLLLPVQPFDRQKRTSQSRLRTLALYLCAALSVWSWHCWRRLRSAARFGYLLGADELLL